MKSKKKRNGYRFSYDYVKRYIESYDCKLISKEYNNCFQQLKIKFLCGHISTSNFTDFQAKRIKNCTSCNKKETGNILRKSEKDWIKLINDSGFIFLRFNKKYKNRKSIVIYKCKFGHITKRRLECFYSNRTCSECKKIDFSKFMSDKRFSIDKVKKILFDIHKNNISLLNYTKINSLADFLCNVCGNKWTVIARSVLENKNGCPECGKRRIGLKLTKPEKIVLNELYEKHGKNISMNNYSGMGNFANFTCNVCGYKWRTKTYSVITDGRGCKRCSFNNISGKNNYNWKGGKTSLYFYLRNLTKEWQKNSYATTSGICLISGKAANVVHHLYPFRLIVDEVLLSVKINNKGSINNYEKEELETIFDNFTKIHNSYGLGIPLDKSIHRKFHHIFGTRNNTPEQFYEFQNKIKSGEIII